MCFLGSGKRLTVLSSCYFSVCQLRGEAAAQGADEDEAEKRQRHACDGVENPITVVAEVMDHHMASYLLPFQSVVPYLQEADGLVGKYVEHKHVERVVADEYEYAGKSGKTIEGRAQFSQMMEDIYNKLISATSSQILYNLL